ANRYSAFSCAVHLPLHRTVMVDDRRHRRGEHRGAVHRQRLRADRIGQPALARRPARVHGRGRSLGRGLPLHRGRRDPPAAARTTRFREAKTRRGWHDRFARVLRRDASDRRRDVGGDDHDRRTRTRQHRPARRPIHRRKHRARARRVVELELRNVVRTLRDRTPANARDVRRLRSALEQLSLFGDRPRTRRRDQSLQHGSRERTGASNPARSLREPRFPCSHRTTAAVSDSLRPMNVCVLANPMLTRFEERALENVAALDGVGIERVVVDASVSGSAFEAGADAINEGGSISLSDLELFAEVVRENGLEAVIYADQKLGWMLGATAQREWLTTTSIAEVTCLDDATLVECEPVSAGGAWNTLPEDETDEIAASCDVVIRFGFGLLK